ncbi:MAG TPA: ATP-dependent DNA ligase [Pseudonocardiaceae bacterium]
MVTLGDVVAASGRLTGTRSRKAKTQALAALLGAAGPDELGLVVGFLTGQLRQGRFGIGWSTLGSLDAQPATTPELGVRDVDERLDQIAHTTGSGSAARRRALLGGLLRRATGDEQRFLVALLTGDLRQGALEGVMLDAVAAASEVPADVVRRAYMICGRLPDTAVAAMAGGVDALHAFRLELGRPVRPMLASPADSLDDALAELGAVSVEYKLDGARIQVHRDGDVVRVWTRTLREITASVPELVELVRGLPCRTVVLDGETLALTDDGRPRSFQDTMSRFGAESPRELLLRPFFFDCLQLDGEDLLDAALRDRLAALRTVAGEHLIASERDPLRAPALLDAALAAGHEGVVVKSLDSPYAAGRRGRAWQKVKPVHTLDLVVLAAEWGHGRRRGWLSNLHLGARDPDGGPPIMVGKTFKGLTDQLLTWQTGALQEIAQHTDQHVVHVRPELVVEIELDGVQRSPRYPGGLALRFARVVRYRPDKEPRDADTIDAVRALVGGSSSTTHPR